MTLEIKVFCTGQLGNNVSVLFNEDSRKAIVFDPSYEPQSILEFIQGNQLQVENILLTHGHFDHFAGVDFLLSRLPHKPKVGMHRTDLELLRDGGGSKKFHMPIFLAADPDFFIEDRQIIHLGNSIIEVRTAPGHTPGSVIFVIPQIKSAVCGDLIFYHGVGRTDLAGGDMDVLLASIREQVFSLPPDTRLIPGHGEETTVGEEMERNPFLNY